MDPAEVKALAQAIIHQHSANFGAQLHHDANSVELTPQPVPPALRQDPIYQAALKACSQLGFIACDAHTLALAWQRQSQRLGAFDASLWPSHAADFGLSAPDPAHAFAPCPQALGPVRRAARCRLGRPHGARRRAHGAAALQER